MKYYEGCKDGPHAHLKTSYKRENPTLVTESWEIEKEVSKN